MFETCEFMVFVSRSSPYHVPIKYRCSIKENKLNNNIHKISYKYVVAQLWALLISNKSMVIGSACKLPPPLTIHESRRLSFEIQNQHKDAKVTKRSYVGFPKCV